MRKTGRLTKAMNLREVCRSLATLRKAALRSPTQNRRVLLLRYLVASRPKPSKGAKHPRFLMMKKLARALALKAL